MTSSQENDHASSASASEGRSRRWGHIIVFLYLLLLGVSHGVRYFTHPDATRPNQKTLFVHAVDKDTVIDKPVSIAYVDTYRRGDEERPVLMVLHGSPFLAGSMMNLHSALSRYSGYRIITPDLPGFAGSTLSIPDYSVRAHARYLVQMLDSLKIQRAHIIAYSMSGGVAIELDRIAPDRISGLTLLSSIGVQEFELTGNYHINHAVHGLQLGLLWLIQEGFPHFGRMDGAILSTSYARNFFDTDQRPFRDALAGYQGPLQIIHGKDDLLVPFEAALEHERIVPQSELNSFDSGGHGLAFSAPDTLASLIDSFVRRTAEGNVKDRRNAEPDRILRSGIPFDSTSRSPASGMSLVILCTLIVLATLVSEDLTSIGAGLMAASGTLSFAAAAGASFGGIVFGDILIYILGRTVGSRILRSIPMKWFISPARLIRGQQWFRQYGTRLVFSSRFIPGSRFATYFSAGVMHTPFGIFLACLISAAAIWAPLVVGVSMISGKEFWDKYGTFESFALEGAIALLLVLYLGIRLVPSLLSYRGRRLFLSRWYRLTRWEFWPLPVFYIPVVFYVLWLGLRFRSLTIFTAANPGIPHGGFKGESKLDILNGLHSSGRVPVFAEVPLGAESNNFVLNFVRQHGLEFPVVLKPVEGERGRDVAIIRDDTDLRHYFAESRERTIVQEYASGHEFGVFYYRFPGQRRGHIFSITDKRLPVLIGDGSRTVERLILDDPRAVCMARFHLDRMINQLDRIPDEGEIVKLVEIGTHSRGAVFLDATGEESDAFVEAIDLVARSFDGFYFGRFDIRISGDDPLNRGDNFKIIELNGVTSESTNIYDPKFSLTNAYRMLFKQWQIAFEIGYANARAGARVASIRELFSLLFPPANESHR